MIVMDSRARRLPGTTAVLLVGASMLGLSAAPTLAQTAQATGVDASAGKVAPDGSSTGRPDDIIVTGIRQSNLNAIRIKRNSDTVVDAITAEDIGALPDKSITETLQRIPGVAINRFAAINDPDHVSEEGQSPVIRGLPYVQSEFNGRDAFTANRGRALNFQDIPPDLAASVEVYKNQTADQIEGGIAGVINIVTRRPLDTTKNFYVFNADANWGDLRKKFTPEFSGLISQQWDTGAGRFGILGTASFSQLDERVTNARVTTYRDYRSAGTAASNPGVLASTSGGLTGATPGVDYYVPLGGGYSRQDNDRERTGFSGAAQWESTGGDLLATLQYIHSGTVQTYTERTLAPVEDTGNIDIVGGVGAATFNRQNVFTSGTLSSPGFTNGIDTQELNRGERLRSTTNDYSAHLQWKATERLHLDADVQYATSTSYTLDTSVVAVASPIISFDDRSGIPITTFKQAPFYSGDRALGPGIATDGYNNQPIGFFATGTNPTADPGTTFWRSAQDHQDNTTGNEFAFRADGVYDVGDGFLKRIRFGARYADRKQTIRSDGYNWGNLSERWHGGITTPGQVTPPGFGVVNVGSFFRGAPGYSIFGIQGNPAINYAQLQQGVVAIKGYRGLDTPNSFFYFPLYTGTRNGSNPDPNSIINGAGDGFHRLDELSTNDEKTYAGYARIDFSGDSIKALDGIKVDGNIGLRYTRTTSSSFGYFSVPPVSGVFGAVPDCTKPGGGRLNGSSALPSYNICLNSADFRNALLTFLGNNSFTSQPNTTREVYDDFLPSFNLRVAPSDEVQFRFAYSKALTRPSFNDLRNGAGFSVPGPVGTLAADAPFPAIALKATSYGNPRLHPTTSQNFDLTGEWYYSKQGSFTLGLFYKQLTNVYSVLNGIAGSNGGVTNNIGVDPTNPAILTYINNGQALQAFNSVTANNNRKVAVKGFEIDFRQNSFSFLPSPLDGVGVTFNFTYIDADRLKAQSVLAANFDSSAGTGYNPNTGYLTSFAFPGISKYNLNAEIFYEKYGVQARVAYTWRSSYFVSSQDSLGPNDPTYTDASGFVDGSIFYAVNKNLKVGVTGSNILNQTITTRNQITQSGILALRAVNQSDRRITAGVRVGF